MSLVGPASLDLLAGPVELTGRLVDLPSVSGDEGPLADAVEAALRAQATHLEVLRDGHALIARTQLGMAERVVIAGHLDTVPIAGNVPSIRDGDAIRGCGSTDMKGGVAVALHLAAALTQPSRDISWVFYDCEEVDSARNGLGRLQRQHSDWLAGDLAVLMEPTGARIEAGCQGTLRATIALDGIRAHTARNWVGRNAIHAAAPILQTLAAYDARRVTIDGCEFREGLSAVRIEGGVAGNVVPDVCTVTVNYRFAPDRGIAEATEHLRDVFPDHPVTVVDAAAGALPGLSMPAAADFVAAIGSTTGAGPSAKLGWTDVARFSELGIPAVNYGPGDPLVAHTVDEWVDTREITAVAAGLRAYLTA